MASASVGDRSSGALGAIEVAGRRLDADGRRRRGPGSPRCAARIASRCAPSRGRAATIVRSTPTGRQPASASRATTVREQLAAVDAGGRRGVGREQPAEVPEAGGAQQGVGDGVQDDVAVRVTVQARRAGDLDAAQAQRLARPERMRVVADPGPPGRRRRRRAASAARARSAGTVTLRLAGSPGTTWTAILQASSRAASSVQVAVRASGGRRARHAGGRAGRPAASARPPARTDPRSPRSRSPSIRFRVSATGTTGMAAPCAAAASTTAATSAADTTGRAPSWTRTTRSPSGSGSARSSASNPGRTESWRRSPPSTNGRRRATVRQPRAVLELAPPLRRRHDDDRRDLRGGRAAPSSVWASSGRPPIRARSLSVPPIRAEAPAATTIASATPAVTGRPLNRAAAGRRSSDRPRSGGPA